MNGGGVILEGTTPIGVELFLHFVLIGSDKGIQRKAESRVRKKENEKRKGTKKGREGKWKKEREKEQKRKRKKENGEKRERERKEEKKESVGIKPKSFNV